MCRGYYTRSVLVAYDYAGGVLVKRWKFDTYNSTDYAGYAGQGNHNLRVADVDGDGFDEIIYGSMAIDHDGTGLYNTGLGHGDAQHLTDFIPERPGLEVLSCHENKTDGTTLRDAATGEILWQLKSGDDVGRCMGTDIAGNFRGMEFWSSRSSGIINANNLQTINSSTSSDGEEHKLWLDMNYHGYIFSDTVAIRFANIQSESRPAGKAIPVELVNSLVKSEISIRFEEKGMYDCFVYTMNGNLVKKPAIVVGGKSVQTFSIVDLPAGNYIIAIENRESFYKTKFLKI
jgi:hypothetical protein